MVSKSLTNGSHKYAIAMIIMEYTKRVRLHSGLHSTAEQPSIRDLVEEVFRFFEQADSFDFSWVPESSHDTDGLLENLGFRKALAKMALDEQEMEYVKEARTGNFDGLIGLFEARGYLRTIEARTLLANKARGRGNPRSRSTVAEDTWMEVIALKIKQKCTWEHAQNLWLRENSSVSKNTLKSRLKYTEDDKKEYKLIRQIASGKDVEEVIRSFFG